MVKALFPVGKTQWAKWNDTQREAFNEARAAGVPHLDAIAEAGQAQAPKKKKSFFDIIEDVADAVTDAAEVVETVTPVIAVAKTVVRATRKKKAK
jgi:hypothetical protein